MTSPESGRPRCAGSGMVPREITARSETGTHSPRRAICPVCGADRALVPGWTFRDPYKMRAHPAPKT